MRIPFIVIEAFATIVDDLKVALEAFRGLLTNYAETEMKFAYFTVGVAEVSTAKLAVAHRHWHHKLLAVTALILEAIKAVVKPSGHCWKVAREPTEYDSCTGVASSVITVPFPLKIITNLIERI